jgi:hypothetical protein
MPGRDAVTDPAAHDLIRQFGVAPLADRSARVSWLLARQRHNRHTWSAVNLGTALGRGTSVSLSATLGCSSGTARQACQRPGHSPTASSSIGTRERYPCWCSPSPPTAPPAHVGPALARMNGRARSAPVRVADPQSGQSAESWVLASVPPRWSCPGDCGLFEPVAPIRLSG